MRFLGFLIGLWLCFAGLSVFAANTNPEPLLLQGLQIGTQNAVDQSLGAISKKPSEITIDTKDLPGSVEHAQLLFDPGTLILRSGQVFLSKASLVLKADSWILGKKKSLLDVQCRKIEFRYAAPTLKIEQVDNLAFDLKSLGQQKFLLRGTSDVHSLVSKSLQPLFERAALSRGLSGKGDCQGNVIDILLSLGRAYFEDYPHKESKDFSKLIDAIQKRFEEGLELNSESLKNIGLKGLDQLPLFESHLVVTTSADTLSLTTLPLNFLSPAAEQMMTQFESRDDHSWLLLNESALSLLTEILVTALVDGAGTVASDKVPVSEQPLKIPLKGRFRTEQFAPFLKEFDALKTTRADSDEMDLQVVFEDCHQKKSHPKVRPFVSPNGFDRGMDVNWTSSMQFLSKSDHRVLATRSLGELTLTFLFARNSKESLAKGLWTYMGATRNEPLGVDASCPVEALPKELSVSIDWLLNADSLRKSLGQDLFKKFAWTELSASLRVLGAGLPADKRPNGGFFGEALILDFPRASR